MINNIDFPLVSVVIPTYNRSYSLHATIDSVIKQTYKNIEIIIVDDGSTDNTKYIVSSFGNKVVYIQKKHTGQADTRNVGLKYAKGEIIAPLDSDDMWYDEYLENSIGCMIEHKLDLFFSNWEHYNFSKYHVNIFPKFLNNINIPNKGCYIFDYAEFRRLLLIDSIAASSGLIIKKSSIPFGWNSQVNIGDDWFLQLEMIFKNLNCRVGFTNEVFWKKKRDSTNISDGRGGVIFRKLHIKDLHLILLKFSSYLDKQEREMIDLKIFQNTILISYLLLLKGNIGIEMKLVFIYIFKEPQLFLKALRKGIEKVILNKNYQFNFIKNL
ncbi:glycosyltransferase family 2 protein [Flavobacterium taihuense]|uniref:Glycosyltransferase family 2 protein n=1 Tax=Flavobacterium taihuense TaxID=2857508 RepID=A0ABS6XRB8_9FLAO|nr:glycosyltransferase family 2 protein [Flavobacterium taihuense]MBW4358897.1 glycosyltransferase family 2 protein [Flavobacterium taihuense]